MSMPVRLDYGRGGMLVDLAGIPHRVLERRGAPALPDPVDAVRHACAAPIGTPPLAELARGRRSAVVVISDRTRPVPYASVLPPILQTLAEAGIPSDAVEIPRRHRAASAVDGGRAGGDDGRRHSGALPHPEPRRA